MSGHFIKRCKHGVVQSQCRCIGNKQVTIVACPPECLKNAPVMHYQDVPVHAENPIGAMSDMTPSDLLVNLQTALAQDPEATAEDNRAVVGGSSDLLDRLNTRCLSGHPPGEYLRALAVRAKEEAEVSTTPSWQVAMHCMAKQLEAWADE